MTWKAIDLNTFSDGLFPMLDKGWFLLSASANGKTNTMTISWGGFGILYNKPYVMVTVRPERYTKEFIDQTSTFSLTAFDNKYKKQLAYLGSVSGRDEDKMSQCGLTLAHRGDTPYFEEANMTIICDKFARVPMPESHYIDHPEIQEEFYGKNGNPHDFYFAFIEEILIKE